MNGYTLKSVLAMTVCCVSLHSGNLLQAQTANLLVNLDASTLSDTTVWINTGTLSGDFTPTGNPVLQTIAGKQAVTFSGQGDAFAGPATPSTLTGNHARTIEVWVYNPDISDEETMVAWGQPANTAGADLAFNYGASSSTGAARHGNLDLNWGTLVPAAEAWHYLVYTYDETDVKVYDNGVLANQRAAALATSTNGAIVIGAQNDASGAPQVAFSGSLSIASVMIRDGALTASQISSNFLQAIGALQTIDLQLDTNMVVGGKQPATVFGNYAKLANLEITSLPAGAFTSGNTNVLTVSSAGVVTAVAAGTTTIQVQYQGFKSTKTVTVSAPVPAVLKYRYSFNDAEYSSTTAESVSGANGSVIGTTAFADGALAMDGSDGYVNLPNGLISALKNVTLDLWVNWSGDGIANEPIFDFGGNSSGEDMQGDATSHLWLTPMDDNGVLRFSVSDGVTVESLTASAALPAGKWEHITVVYSYGTLEQKLYVDGALVDTKPLSIALSSIDDVNNWLGCSQTSTYRNFNGQYGEFRIYDGVLTADQIFMSDAVGMEQIGNNAGSLKSISARVPSASMLIGALQQASVLATYDTVTNLDITSWTGVAYQSSDSAVVTVSASGQLEAVAVGTASIIAQYQTLKATNSISVIAAPGVPVTPSLTHRYSFNETNGVSLVADSVGGADGELMGDGTPNFSGGKLALNGAVVELPGQLISGLTNVTIEAWVTWAGGSKNDQQVFEFGGGDPLTWLGICARRSDTKALGFSVAAADTDALLSAASALPTNHQTHVVLSYNQLANTARLYLDGVKAGLLTGVPALSDLKDTAGYLGTTVSAASATFDGTFDEFRIYSGAMSDAEVAASFAGGPDTLPGSVTTAPTLKVTHTKNNVILSWIQTGTGFILQATENPGLSTSWQTVPTTQVSVGETNQLALTSTTGKMFYRLKK
jgi:hypothetical protein